MKDIILRAAGVVIRDKKILLVTGNNQPFYWTPGGKLDPDETVLGALNREFQEELGIKIIKAQHYFDYFSPADEEEDHKSRQIHAYAVEFAGEPQCAQEISSMVWVSRDDIINGRIILQSGVKNYLIPKLIKDNLL